MKKILIIGSTGMAGHMVYKYLSDRKDFDLFNLAFRKPLNSSTVLVDVKNTDAFNDILISIRPDFVINCTGILINGAKNNPANAIFVNSYFPHKLSSLVNQIGARLIHISTDCVFSGSKGNYQPDDAKDAQDVYGMSKALGEVFNGSDLTIRTSIIGPELKTDGEGLLHWFLNQSGKIYGYTDAYWTGVTTLQLAKIIEQSIDNKISGLLQYSSGIKISKFHLLQVMQQAWQKTEIEIIPVPGKKIDKSLVPSHPLFTDKIPDYLSMCIELADHMKKNHQTYLHYYEDSSHS